MNLAELTIKNPLIACICILILLFGGWQAYENMPRFEDPEFTIRTAKVITQYPGASPEEVVDQVTEPLETAIQQLAEVETVGSTSSDGRSEITVEILFDASPTKEDLKTIWTKLRNKVADTQGSLPQEAGTSVVQDDFGDVYGIYYLITGEGYSPTEVLAYAKALRKELALVDGVAKVGFAGEREEAIFIEVSRSKAASLGLSLNEVYSSLDDQNAITSAGKITVGDTRVQIDPTGRLGTVDAIKRLEIGDTGGGSITRLGNIANVTRGYNDPPTQLIRYKGLPAIGIGIANMSGVNVVELGEDIDATLQRLESQRPGGMEVDEFYHQGKVVDESVEDFVTNLITALLIVFITLFIFMGFRSGVVMGATVLITIAATLLVMWLIDIPMHRISLGALVISLGMLVDNGVVITDGILKGVEEGKNKLEVAIDVTKRNLRPLVGGTLVGIIAFAPIGFAEGSTAEFTNSLFWVVLIALAFSWLFAFTLTPLFCYWLFPDRLHTNEGDHDTKAESVGQRFMDWYERLIRQVLANKGKALLATLLVFAASIWGFAFTNTGFFPASSTPQVIVDFYLPYGTKIERTDADMKELETYAASLDGVEAVQTIVGKGTLRYTLSYNAVSENSAYGQLLIQTTGGEENDRVIGEMQRYIDSALPDSTAKAWKFIMGPSGGAKIQASFSGPDSKVLRRLANEAKVIMTAEGGVLIQDDWRRKVPVIQPEFSPNKGERVGISRKDVSETLEENFSGIERGKFREGDTLIPIISRAPQSERVDPSSMLSIQVLSPTSGETVPLAQVLNGITTEWRDAQIVRSDRIMTINAECDPAQGVRADELFKRLQAKIEQIDLPDGYTLEWEGEFGDSAEAQSSIASTIPLGLTAMVLVVIFVFNALRQPVVIWAVVPLMMVGITIGLLVTRATFDFMAILGLLSLSGLLIQNSLVLVDTTDELIAAGKHRFDALVESASSRLRPVMMGAFTTVFGVMPLYFDVFFQGMTVVLAFGLTFGTLMTLLITPVLYALIFRIQPDDTASPEIDPSTEEVAV